MFDFKQIILRIQIKDNVFFHSYHYNTDGFYDSLKRQLNEKIVTNVLPFAMHRTVQLCN